MRLELKQIEATLQQVAAQNAVNGEQISLDHKKESLSSSPREIPASTHASETSLKPQQPLSALKVPSSAVTSNTKTPALPNIKQSSLSSHRHGINPNLPMTLLKEIEAMAAGWQSELKQILQQIQDIYLEGPIVEGWLESAEEAKPQGEEKINTSPTPFFRGYRLCGIGGDGKLWSRSISSQQVAEVSLAIARAQKLRQFLQRQQQLEHRLSELAEMLILVQGNLPKP